jgi:undecaprenyl pyrophosphate synthase
MYILVLLQYGLVIPDPDLIIRTSGEQEICKLI